MNLETLSNIKPIVKWKVERGFVFDSVLSAFCSEVISHLETKANELFTDTKKDRKERALLAVFLEMGRFFEEELPVILKKELVVELLSKEKDPWIQERIDNWVSSCKGAVNHFIKEIESSEAQNFCVEDGLVIEHWQCSKNPCYKIYHIALKAKENHEYLSPFFKIGGQPSKDRDWPGYYGAEVSLSDFKRYWDTTLKTKK